MVVEFQTVFFGVRTTQVFEVAQRKLTVLIEQMHGGEWHDVGVYRHNLNPGDGFLMFSTMNADKEQPKVGADGNLIVPEWCEKYIVS